MGVQIESDMPYVVDSSELMAKCPSKYDGPQLAALNRHRHVLHGNQVAEPLGDVANFQHGQDDPRRRRMPSRPRGKNNTTSTKIAPTNDIQFTVIDEM